MTRVIFPLWIFASVLLLLYSFTQVDLSLTLSQVSIWQGIQKGFQYIGYFNRPLSAYLFVGIVVFMFILYGLTLKLIKDNKISLGSVTKIVILICAILLFSYNAFSHDIFNYIFDAKILTFYHQNPYEHKALDYPGDPMLSFMHWTHRTYPYGPLWLAITSPLSYIGLGYFSVTFFLFKLLMVFSFGGSVYLIGRIARKLDLNPAMIIAVFALNPLVIIESTVSAHNDIVMIFFALITLLFFLEKKYIKSLFGLIFSVAIKYATVLIIPSILLKGLFGVNKNTFLLCLTISMLVAVIFATYRTNFQPWYLLYVIPFAAFMYSKKYIFIPIFIVSFFGLMQYVPYLFLGNWDPPVPTILNNLMIASIIISAILILSSHLFISSFSKRK